MAVIKRDGNSMGLPMNINRGNPIPLDTTSVWYSLEEAQNYAKSGATAYVGQVITVVDETNNKSQLYVIQNKAGDLLAINGGSESSANKGKLKFGSYIYDGSEDVTVAIYEGTVEDK